MERSKAQPFSVCVFALMLWSGIWADKAAASPSLQLAGGVLITSCYQGNCYTLRWYCVNPPRGDFEATVTGAAPNSTVTFQLLRYYPSGGGGFWYLAEQWEVGTTDENGYFHTIGDPPPGTNGSFKVYAIVGGDESNTAEYRNGVGSGVCS